MFLYKYIYLIITWLLRCVNLEFRYNKMMVYAIAINKSINIFKHVSIINVEN